ncbi:zinc ribbon domain-containing protein [Candidatus Harpocratesius sp.]
MNLTMVQFNTLFKQKMQDAKIIEKTHPRDAEKVWFELTLFMINFAKSSNCPRKLRKQLIYQADTIVKKIKLIRAGLISSVVDSKLSSQEIDELLRSIKEREQSLISKPTSSETESFEKTQFSKLNESEDEEVVYSQLQEFPDVPDDLLNPTPINENQDSHISSMSTINTGENENPDISEIPSNNQAPQVNPFFLSATDVPEQPTDVSINNHTSMNNNKNSLTTNSETNNNDSASANGILNNSEKLSSDLEKLSRIEDELKKIPDIMKEVAPAPFSNASIITPGAVPSNTPILDQFKQAPTTLDVTKSSAGSIISEDQPEILSKQSTLSNQPSSLKIVGFEDPKKKLNDSKTISTNYPNDPFGPESISDDLENETSKEKYCFACGGKLNPSDPICPHCGTENI